MGDTALQLRPDVRAVVAGGRVALFVGGRRILRIVGPVVARTVIPTLAMLDAATSYAAILRATPEALQDEVATFLADLRHCGLLAPPAPADRPLCDSDRFFRRLGPGDGDPPPAGQREILLSAKDPKIVEELGVLLGANGFRWTPGPATPRIEGARSRIEASGAIVSLTCHDREPLPRTRRVAVEVLQQCSSGNPEEYPLALAHAAHLVTAALHGTARESDLEASRPTAAATVSAPQRPVPEFFRQCRGEEETASKLRMIARIAAGGNPQRQGHRTSPTAGDLRSTGIYLVDWRRATAGRPLLSFYDAGLDSFEALTDLDQAEAAAAFGEAKSPYLLLIAAHTAALRRNYGDLAERLALFEMGVVADHVLRAARAFAFEPILGFLDDPAQRDARHRLLRCGPPGLLDCAIWLNLHVDQPKSRQGPGCSPAVAAAWRRRSVRSFAPEQASMSQLRAIEKSVAKALPRLASNAVPPPLDLVRLLRGAGPHAIDRISVRTGASVALDPSVGEEVSSLIRQPDLAAAPIIYFVATSNESQDDRGAADIWAGIIGSALWIEGVRVGLEGTMYGGVPNRPLRPSGHMRTLGLALCLGRLSGASPGRAGGG